MMLVKGEPDSFRLLAEGYVEMSVNKAPGRESLGEFVRRVRLDKKLSLTEVERQSGRVGKRIAASYVNRIENEINTRPSADRLIALAHGLGIPEEELFAVARGRTHRSETDARAAKMMAYFSELPAELQGDVMTIVEALHRERAKKASRRAA